MPTWETFVFLAWKLEIPPLISFLVAMAISGELIYPERARYAVVGAFLRGHGAFNKLQILFRHNNSVGSL